ncbi:hypothetical protein AgCh_013430 [Apium graveolens]
MYPDELYFRKEVIFVVDISESMQRKPLEGTKNALVAALSKLDHGDSFNVIAFIDEVHIFSLSMELATKKAIEKVTDWMSMNLIARGGLYVLDVVRKEAENCDCLQALMSMSILAMEHRPGSAEVSKELCLAILL